MRINKTAKAVPIFTHEGAPAAQINAKQALKRSVLACLLWEDSFYESGEDIGARITKLAAKCPPEFVSALAYEARNVFGLRHAPLLLLADLIRRGGAGVASAIERTVVRADEMSELVALYWKLNPNKGLSAQMKKGLARAFVKFDEYQLAKYDRENVVKLRDVIFLSHAKPTDEAQAALFKRVANRELAIPDTWETNLSGGADKKETFTRLLTDKKLGYLALLRNLRNMVDAGVDRSLIEEALLARRGAHLVFPFRFTAAARAVPQLEPVLDKALVASVAAAPKLSGKTIVLVDVSGSMDARMSGKSDLMRIDAAATLASVLNCESLRVFTFSDNVKEVPPRTGMAGVDVIIHSQTHSSTRMGEAIMAVNAVPHDRLIVISDEQSHSAVPNPAAKHAYMINVASYQNGVGYGNGWTHLDGFSEAVVRYITESEAAPD